MSDDVHLMLERDVSYLLIVLRFSLDVSVDCFRYGSCATSHDFEIYAPHASFEDPLMCAHGYVLEVKDIYQSLILFILVQMAIPLTRKSVHDVRFLWIKIMSDANYY